MKITLVPDTYVPSVDETGKYIDCIPQIKNGIKCPCNTSNTEKIYISTSKFKTHTKTKMHQNWLLLMNNNKTNHYKENIDNNKLLKSQQILIQKYTNELKTKDIIIENLKKYNSDLIIENKKLTDTLNEIINKEL